MRIISIVDMLESNPTTPEKEPTPSIAVLLDLDGTLLNSGAMMDRAFVLLEEEFGLLPGQLHDRYDAYRKQHAGDFSVDGFVKYLSNFLLSVNFRDIEDFDEFTVHFNTAIGQAAMETIYTDVSDLFVFLDQNRQRFATALFSQGERAWQFLKFSNAFGELTVTDPQSGRQPLFAEDMQFVLANKTSPEALQKIQSVLMAKGVTQAVVVDDRPEALQTVQANWPGGIGVTCILIKRPGQQQAYGTNPNAQVASLPGIQVIASLKQVETTLDATQDSAKE